jgi:hypothetical protein
MHTHVTVFPNLQRLGGSEPLFFSASQPRNSRVPAGMVMSFADNLLQKQQEQREHRVRAAIRLLQPAPTTRQ